MLDVAAHMLLLQRQAQIKRECPADGSFLPLSLTVACLLRQLPAGLAPPAGILSFHQIDRLPIEVLEQKLVRLLYGEDADTLPPRGSAMLARAFEFLRAMVVYVKTTRTMLALCHGHLTDQLSTAQATQALIESVVASLGVVADEEDDDLGLCSSASRGQQVDDEEEEDDEGDRGDEDEMYTGNRQNQPRIRSSHSSRLRKRQSMEKVALPPAPSSGTQAAAAAPLPEAGMTADPSGIMKRALARDAGDGAAIVGIMKKYPDDPRLQTHGVRALKSAIRKFPFQSPNQRSARGVDSQDEDDDEGEDGIDPLKDPMAPEEIQRREVVQLVLHTMKRFPDHLALQRDALFCLLEYVSRADEHVAMIASLGGIVSIMEAMARLPDDEEAQIAALSVLGHPTLAEDSVVRVNPESRRLVMSAMRRFPLSERLQGLACLALANLSLRQDDSMREIVARGGLELVVAAMNRFSDVSLIQAAGSWLLTTVSTKDDEMLAACLDAGGLPPCERARVRFAMDPRVQQHAVNAIESMVRDVPEHATRSGEPAQAPPDHSVRGKGKKEKPRHEGKMRSLRGAAGAATRPTRLRRETCCASRARARSLRMLVVFAALVACLWALPQPATAIITPDEPTPPKPSAAGGQRQASADAPSPPTSVTPSSKPVGSADAPVTADAKDATTTTSTSRSVLGSSLSPPPGATAAATSAVTTAAANKQPAPAGSVEGAVARERDAEKASATNMREGPTTATSPSPPNQPSSPTTSSVEVVHERYVRGRGASGGEYFDDDDFDDRDLFASSSFEIEDSDADAGGAPGSGKRQNYASLDAGATILDSSPELKSPTNLLVPDKDRYMLMPCEKPRKWVVVSLSEDVHADAIAVANFEKFSSTVKEFIVLGSVNYPTDTWFVLGNFTAAQQNGEQIFPLDSQHHVRYIKLRFFSHYGSEYYCTLSQLKVYGRTFTQVISQLEKSIDAEGALEMTALPPPTASTNVDGTKKGGESGASFGDHDFNSEVRSEPSELSHQCPAEDAIRSILTGAMATAPTCSIVDEPKQSPVKAPPFLPQPNRTDYHPDTDLTTRELAALEALGRHVDPQQMNSPPSAPSNGSTTGATGTARSNGSASAVAPSSTTTNGLHAQGLGRLESIFVRITKKIQQLELNQSLFARQLEETHAQQKALATSLHAKQDVLAAQMQDIRTILTDMRARMDRESLSSEQYHRLVDELRKENVALWNEMLVVREVITTMKAAILCALALSACIIMFYLLRLLFRCIQSAKRRADLREWFWRMESLTQHQNEDPDASTSEPANNEPVGSLRVNYKKQFGSSWDDLAIERKTLLRDLVDEEASSLQTVHGGHRNKRLRTASLVNPPKLTDLMVQMELAHLAAETGAFAGSDIALKEEPGSDIALKEEPGASEIRAVDLYN